MQRIEEKDIEAMVEDSKASLAQADAPAVTENNKPAAKDKSPAIDANTDAEQTDYIGIEDFAKVEMKVAKVLECNHVEGADKLLQFTLDVGEEKPRNVYAFVSSMSLSN